MISNEPCKHYQEAPAVGAHRSTNCNWCGWDRSEHAMPGAEEAKAALADLEVPTAPPVEATLSMPPDAFAELVNQQEDALEMYVPWEGTDDEKEDVLADIASLTLSFTVARLYRFQQQMGEPRALHVRVEVIPEGGVEPVKSTLFVP